MMVRARYGKKWTDDRPPRSEDLEMFKEAASAVELYKQLKCGVARATFRRAQVDWLYTSTNSSERMALVRRRGPPLLRCYAEYAVSLPMLHISTWLIRVMLAVTRRLP